MLIVVLAFLISRLLYHLAGVRFDTQPLTYFMQIIDPELLRHRLLESILYLHTQPPLFNLFCGFVLKLFPNGYPLAFQLIYMLLGLITSLVICVLMLKLGIPSRISTVLTILFVISPTTVLMENWLFYTHLNMAYLSFSALALFTFLEKKRLTDGIIFFTLLGILVLTRSLFQLIWMAFFIALLISFSRRDAFMILAASIIPFLIVTAWYAKNLVLFGTFSSTTWTGQVLAENKSFLMLTTEERKTLVKNNEISKIFKFRPFREPATYRKLLGKQQKTGIPVLDRAYKSDGRHFNLNNFIYIEANRLYLIDSMRVIRDYPRAYLGNFLHSLYLFFHNPIDIFFHEDNRLRIEKLDRLWNLVFYGQILNFEDTGVDRNVALSPSYFAWFTALYFLIAVIYGAILLIRSMKVGADQAIWTTVLFMWCNIIYVTLGTALFEFGENDRFRFMIDPFILIILGLFLTDLGRYLSNLNIGLIKHVEITSKTDPHLPG